MHGHNNYASISASNCERVLLVMDARARARGTVFEKAHARMSNGKYTENCWAETETSTETTSKELAGLH